MENGNITDARARRVSTGDFVQDPQDEQFAVVLNGHTEQMLSTKDAANFFATLSDQTRLQILLFLSVCKELHVTKLCQLLGQSQPAVSHHLAIMSYGGLLECRRSGKHNYYRISDPEHISRIFLAFQKRFRMPQNTLS